MRCDIAVIGAGPAGLAAAAAAAGRSVVVVDLAARPGGQYFRHPVDGQPTRGRRTFARLLSGARVLSGHRVYAIEPGKPHVLHLTGETRVLRADAVLIATGAYDRVLPFPGWDLPGVMTVGGAQSLLKGSRVLPGRRIVVAGSGPFLLPVAAGLATAGADVVGVFDRDCAAGFVRYPGVVARNPAKIVEAAGYLATLAHYRVPLHSKHSVVAAHGTDELVAVTVGRERIECDTLAVGNGFTPLIDLGIAIGCATRIRAGSLVLAVDARQRTSVPGVFAAGEVTGVGGAALAMVTGALAGRAMAGLPPTNRLLRARARHAEFAATLAKVWAAQDSPRLTDDTVVCRCEEVRYGAVRAAVAELGARDARAVKLLTRTGMGWCQGRTCGDAVSLLVSRLTGTEPEPGGMALRILAQPVTLGELSEEET
ncbi:MAG TPA: FAD-dependent oxidoreductase [Pseudonocardiaceae bacterium]|jgi:NADPH-dependent 2,4-dienoyl-CoA reductase/sulfur reductase-like enzyme|nr:FAD-dependent oxidoreductase [Pseudonocardiaceae bacterium]